MREVKRSYYRDGSFYDEVVYMPDDSTWTTEKPSEREGYVRRITFNRYDAVIDDSEYFPEDRLPVRFEWGFSRGPVPSDITRNKRCSVYRVCSVCKTSSSYYRIAKFVASHPDGVSHVDIAQYMGHKIRHKIRQNKYKYKFFNSTTMLTILKFVGAIAFDKNTRKWTPGPNSERFLETVEKRSYERRNYGNKA